MKRIFIIMAMGLAFTTSMAQKVGVIIDMETHVPIRNVKVIVDGDYKKTQTTDYRGTYQEPVGYRCLTMICEGYERRLVNVEEWKDTLALLPAYNKIHEVVVIGDKKKAFSGILGAVRKEASIAGMKPSGGIGFDFFSIFDKNHVSAKKKRERMKAIENY